MHDWIYAGLDGCRTGLLHNWMVRTDEGQDGQGAGRDTTADRQDGLRTVRLKDR